MPKAPGRPEEFWNCVELGRAKCFHIIAMDCPARIVARCAAALLAVSSAASEDTAATESPAGPGRERAISPHVAALLAATAPKFETPDPAAMKPEVARMDISADKPANGIIRLPSYMVREPRLPTPEQVMTARAVEQYAMKKYLGPENGLDRGVLNLFTIAQFWRKIPVIGQILPPPFLSITNEERAMMFYAEDERLRKMNDFSEMATLMKKSGAKSDGDKLKREIDKAFMRDP